MVNYKVVNYTANFETPHIQRADVLEVETNQVIKNQVSVVEARETCRYLNFGGGFDGNTPNFFLQKQKITNLAGL